MNVNTYLSKMGPRSHSETCKDFGNAGPNVIVALTSWHCASVPHCSHSNLGFRHWLDFLFIPCQYSWSWNRYIRLVLSVVHQSVFVKWEFIGASTIPRLVFPHSFHFYMNSPTKELAVTSFCFSKSNRKHGWTNHSLRWLASGLSKPYWNLDLYGKML